MDVDAVDVCDIFSYWVILKAINRHVFSAVIFPIFNTTAVLSQWKPRDAAVTFDTYWSIRRHRAVLPAIYIDHVVKLYLLSYLLTA